MQQLLKRAQEGDLTSLPQLRSFLDSNPELWQHVGDLAAHAELTMLTLVAGNDLLAKETIQRKLADLKAELGGPSPSPLEKLLIERLGICWLQVHYLDIKAVEALTQDKGETTLSVYAQKRLDSANRRYLQAIRALATIRKLLPKAPSPVEIAEHLEANSKKTRAARSRHASRRPKVALALAGVEA
jgi:hypothetical protein